jgi:hypothetical protein
VPVLLKLIIGLMAAWGTVYALMALAGDFALSPEPGSGHVTPSGLEAFLIHVHAANALAVFLIEAAIALTLPRLPVSRRVTWVFGMMFFYPLAVPAFWYLHIWRTPPGRKPVADEPPSAAA